MAGLDSRIDEIALVKKMEHMSVALICIFLGVLSISHVNNSDLLSFKMT